MIYKPKYNPRRDIKKVEPDAALDLKNAFATNTVPSNLEGAQGSYNGVDDPSGIMRITDPIDAAMKERYIKDYKKPTPPADPKP